MAGLTATARKLASADDMKGSHSERSWWMKFSLMYPNGLAKGARRADAQQG